VADAKEELIAVISAAMAVNSGPGDYTKRARVVLAAIEAHLQESNLYRTVWSIIEEFIVEAKPIDLNEPEGMARMQTVCSLLTVALNPDVHSLNLEAE
jgi:hypothetical protein